MKKRLLAGIMACVIAASVLVTGCGGSKDVKDGTFTPTKTIQWMCTSSAGGGSDIFTRKISDIMTAQNLVNGQTIVVTNKTDGSGEVGRNEVAGLKKNADYQLLTFNSGDLMPMVTNTKNRSSNFRILAVMAVDKKLLFKGKDAKYDTFADVIDAVKAGNKVVIGGSKGDDIATYQALIAELGLSEDQLTYITYDSTGDAITAALGGHVEFVIAKPAAASEYVEAGSLIPILAMGLSALFLKEFPTLRQILFSFLPVAGVVIIILAGSSSGAIQPVGILFVLSACFLSAIQRVINRKAAVNFSAFERTYFTICSSCLFFTANAVHQLGGDAMKLLYYATIPGFIIPVLILSIFCSVTCNILVNYAAGKMSVGRLAAFSNLQTMWSMFAGVLFLREPFGLSSFIGSVLIIYGIWHVTKRNIP